MQTQYNSCEVYDWLILYVCSGV